MWREALLGILGGGVAGAATSGFINYFVTSRSERTARKAAYLKEQLQNLYGPLQFFTSQNAQYFEIVSKLHDAYGSEYGGVKQWSTAEATQRQLGEETNQTLTVSNDYIAKVTANNEQIMGLLKEHPYSAVQVLTMLHDQGFAGGITIVKDYIQQDRKSVV